MVIHLFHPFLKVNKLRIMVIVVLSRYLLRVLKLLVLLFKFKSYEFTKSKMI